MHSSVVAFLNRGKFNPQHQAAFQKCTRIYQTPRSATPHNRPQRLKGGSLKRESRVCCNTVVQGFTFTNCLGPLFLPRASTKEFSSGSENLIERNTNRVHISICFGDPRGYLRFAGMISRDIANSSSVQRCSGSRSGEMVGVPSKDGRKRGAILTLDACS